MKFTTTAYSLSCGDSETIVINKISIRLWKEHSVYHVRGHDYDYLGRTFWERFQTLSEARRCFKAAALQIRVNQLRGVA